MLRRKMILIAVSLVLAVGLSFLQYQYFKKMTESDKKLRLLLLLLTLKQEKK